MGRKPSITLETLQILKILVDNGVNIDRINFINSEKKYITLSEINYYGININQLIKEYNLNPNFPIGKNVDYIKNNITCTKKLKIIEDNKELIHYIGLDKKFSALDEFLDIASILKDNGIDLTKIPTRYLDKQKKAKYLVLSEINQNEIDIDEIIKKYNLNPNFPIGVRLSSARTSYHKKTISKEQKQRMEALNLLEKKSAISEFIDVCKILKNNRVNLNKLPTRHHSKENKALSFYLLSELKQPGIDFNKIIKENNLDPNFPFGVRLYMAREYKNKKSHYKITNNEITELKNLNIFSDTTSETLNYIKILSKNGLNFENFQTTKTKKGEKHYYLLSEIAQKGIDINKIIEENDLDPNFPIGRRILAIKQAYNNTSSTTISSSQKKELEKYKVVKEKISAVTELLNYAEILIKNGVNIQNLQLSKSFNKKQHYFLLSELEQPGIDFDKIIKENNLNPNFPFSFRLIFTRQAYNGTVKYTMAEEDKNRFEYLNLKSIRKCVSKHVQSNQQIRKELSREMQNIKEDKTKND